MGLKHYLTDSLGAVGTDLKLLSWFFEKNMIEPVPGLKSRDFAYLLRQLGMNYRARGFLKEAVDPLPAGHSTNFR